MKNRYKYSISFDADPDKIPIFLETVRSAIRQEFKPLELGHVEVQIDILNEPAIPFDGSDVTVPAKPKTPIRAEQLDIDLPPGRIKFSLTDDGNIDWCGLEDKNGDTWLLRKNSSGMWITVRKLNIQEVEQYQRISGFYPRA